ncbi:hypothetical protein BHM03_00051096 [Ensete ventricosum]|nr:hypothetical protein BHM03_00051096 [Ensete ventricosum]
MSSVDSTVIGVVFETEVEVPVRTPPFLASYLGGVHELWSNYIALVCSKFFTSFSFKVLVGMFHFSVQSREL